MAEEDKAGNSGDKGGSKDSPQQITLEIDGEKKTYGAEDVTNLLAQQASATQKTQKAAALVDAAAKYGVDPDEYVARAEGAFATVVELIGDGVLDEEGKQVKKEVEDVDSDKDKKKVVTTKVDPTKDAASKELEIVNKALGDANKRLGKLEEDNLSLMRKNLTGDLQKEHPELTKDDVSRIFGIAMNDQRKDVWQHAKDFVVLKKEGDAKTREAYAKEFNIDLKEFDENKVKEQDAKGGAAAVVLGKRKLSFKKGKKDAVTPREATLEYFRRLNK